LQGYLKNLKYGWGFRKQSTQLNK